MYSAALPTLRTPRLTLRPLTEKDADAIVDGVGNYDVSRWLGRVPYPYGLSDAHEFLERVKSECLPIWAIENDDGLIGLVGLDEELGYWLARPACRKGYGFEAAHAVIDHWFSDPKSGDLVSGYYDDNHRSQRVLSALGFKEVGRSARFAKSLSQEVPGTDVVLTRADWRARMDFHIESDRLTLRPVQEADAAEFAASLTPSVARNLLRFTAGMETTDIRAMIPKMTWKGLPGFTLAIVHEGKFAGTIGCGGSPVGLGYFLSQELWGKGLMTEALQAFLPELFDRLPVNCLVADHFEDNPNSGSVLRKAGFVETGISMGRSKARVEPAPVITYALHRDNLKVPL
ncbi:MAG: GNAT family N-acetyltransferase [Boseongicola sp.]|nr:GNAT family N-acetyltransferase [Boseongicola sp.]